MGTTIAKIPLNVVVCAAAVCQAIHRLGRAFGRLAKHMANRTESGTESSRLRNPKRPDESGTESSRLRRAKRPEETRTDSARPSKESGSSRDQKRELEGRRSTLGRNGKAGGTAGDTVGSRNL